MLITLIVLAVLNLLVLGYIAWRMPKRTKVVSHFSDGEVGDVASLARVREAVTALKRAGTAC